MKIIGTERWGVRVVRGYRSSVHHPARLVVYGRPDPAAPVGTFPFRVWWSVALRSPVRVGFIVSPSGRKVGLHIEVRGRKGRAHHRKMWLPWAGRHKSP